MARTTEAAELWRRGGYGTIATAMIRDYPLTGVGAGAYRYLAPDYWRLMTNDRLQLDNAQNWWRHQAAELGLLGGAAVMLWSLIVGWQLIAGRPRPDDPVATWTLRGVILGVAGCSLLGMPTQNAVVLLWFFFLVAWMATVIGPPPTLAAPNPAFVRVVGIVAVALAVVYTGAQWVLATGPLAVSARAERFHREYVEGAYAAEALPESGEFHWTDDESRFILPASTHSLVLRMWAHHPDIAQKPVTVTISAPCGLFYRRDLSDPRPWSVGIVLPPSLETVDAVIRVSRTWSPADHGKSDSRRLGVGIVTDFVDNDLAAKQGELLNWPECPG
jgi:hypothetical protein